MENVLFYLLNFKKKIDENLNDSEPEYLIKHIRFSIYLASVTEIGWDAYYTRIPAKCYKISVV